MKTGRNIVLQSFLKFINRNLGAIASMSSAVTAVMILVRIKAPRVETTEWFNYTVYGILILTVAVCAARIWGEEALDEEPEEPLGVRLCNGSRMFGAILASTARWICELVAEKIGDALDPAPRPYSTRVNRF